MRPCKLWGVDGSNAIHSIYILSIDLNLIFDKNSIFSAFCYFFFFFLMKQVSVDKNKLHTARIKHFLKQRLRSFF